MFQTVDSRLSENVYKTHTRRCNIFFTLTPALDSAMPTTCVINAYISHFLRAEENRALNVVRIDALALTQAVATFSYELALKAKQTKNNRDQAFRLTTRKTKRD